MACQHRRYSSVAASVAQWIEQQTSNLQVPGSSPGGGTECAIARSANGHCGYCVGES